ncbi:MAG: TraR/DksA C4-type zinc finger protein [Candidatus Pacebacteria bacterium]|nr:TraR/DksA C4-type zinc finger protein [Candidatus Paceibacterota bacterium]
MEHIETEHLKKKLEEELKILEGELKSVGRRNPDNPADWEALPESNEKFADFNETADTIEGYEENTAILKQLEIRFNEVKDALKRIEEEKYGVCKECGKLIEKERLEANPAAQTCEVHMKDDEK